MTVTPPQRRPLWRPSTHTPRTESVLTHQRDSMQRVYAVRVYIECTAEHYMYCVHVHVRHSSTGICSTLLVVRNPWAITVWARVTTVSIGVLHKLACHTLYGHHTYTYLGLSCLPSDRCRRAAPAQLVRINIVSHEHASVDMAYHVLAAVFALPVRYVSHVIISKKRKKVGGTFCATLSQ